MPPSLGRLDMSSSSLLRYLLGCFLAIFPLFSDQVFQDREGKEIRIVPVKSVDAIDLVRGKDILVRGFMEGYSDVPLADLNPEFKSIGDVRRFYARYFDSELEHYRHGELIWVQAFEGERLLGWATFQLETNEKDAAYMNLLVVDPDERGRGVGKHLTFSIRCLCPHVQAINLLIRKINVAGRQFYERIGFSDFEYKGRDNFVDTSLLTGLRWVEKTSD